MTIPTTQTAFGYIKGEKQIQRFDNVPVPQPKSNEVLLKIEAAGLCMSDPHILIGGPPPSLKGEATKFVMGHEVAGLIVQVGSELTGDSTYKVGARFALTIAQSCGFCKNCRAGKDNACTKSFQAYGLNEDGGFQQYLVIRNLKSLLPIPKALDYATADRDYVLSKYKVHKLRDLENLVADAVQVNIPFNNPITGFCAFTHKAGIHAKAILANPSTYEILNPADFGLTRYIHFANRLTGWNAIKSRVDQLKIHLTDDQCKEVTAKIKLLGDVRPLNIDDVDSIIKDFHADLSTPLVLPQTNGLKDVSEEPVEKRQKLE
jgi:hypothetical protein